MQPHVCRFPDDHFLQAIDSVDQSPPHRQLIGPYNLILLSLQSISLSIVMAIQ